MIDSSTAHDPGGGRSPSTSPRDAHLSLDAVAFDGGEVKALGEGKVAGYLVRFGTPEDADVHGEYFDGGTSFGRSQDLDILYDHGLPMRRGGYWPVFRNRPLGHGSVKSRPDGLWFEGQLDLGIPHVAELYADVEAGRMGWSSGSTERLVIREPVKSRLGRVVHRLLRWPLNEATLSPKPVDPRNKAYAIKALADDGHAADGAGTGRDIEQVTDGVEAGGFAPASAASDHDGGTGEKGMDAIPLIAPAPTLVDALDTLAADAERHLGLATKAADQRLAVGRTLSPAKLDAIKAAGESLLALHRRCTEAAPDAGATGPQPTSNAPPSDTDTDLDLELGLLEMFEAATRR